jgi:ABC-type transport system involved in cytochrome c biogenesis ATPase subunit
MDEPHRPIAGLPFPQELIGSRVIIQGANGAGKTYVIRKILETAHGQSRDRGNDREPKT